MNWIFLFWTWTSLISIGFALKSLLKLNIFAAIPLASLATLLAAVFVQFCNYALHQPVQPGLLFGLTNCCLVVFSLVVTFRCRNKFTETTSHGEFGLICSIAIVASTLWFIAMGQLATPPKDSDAIVHLFTMQWISADSGMFACFVPRDTFSGLGVRFVPCGAHVVGLSIGNLAGLSVPSNLNLLYPYIVFLLPFSAASLGQHLQIGRRHTVLLALASTVFLHFPYGLNGLLPFSLGLALLPACYSCLTDQFSALSSRFAGLIVSCGLLLVHPSTFILLMLMVAVHNVRSIHKHRQKLFFVVSISALAAVAVRKNQMVAYLINGLQTGRSHSSAANPLSLSRVVLETPWTRMQPLLVFSFLVGSLVLLRYRRRESFPYLLILVLFLTNWVVSPSNLWNINPLELVTSGDWYRLLGVLVVLSWLPVATGWNFIFEKFKDTQPALAKFVMLGTLGTSLLSIATGYRIVNQAWNRNGISSSVHLSDFSSIPRLPNVLAVNNPSDGSVFAYSLAGLSLVGAVDRSVDLRSGDLLNALSDPSMTEAVCLSQRGIGYNSVLLVGESLKQVTSLGGVIGELLVKRQSLQLWSLSPDFLRKCSRPGICLEPTNVPEWYLELSVQRFKRNIAWQCDADL